MDLSSIVGTLEAIAPSSTAEDWDNVGLLVEPSSSKPIKHIFLTIDLTEAVLDEVLELNKIGNEIGIIVAYHPPIFKPLKRLTQSSVKERIIIKAIEAGIAIYSPHTAHDNLWGGVNDWILSGFDSGIITPLSVNQRSDTFPFQLSISGIPNRDVFTDITGVLSEVNGTPDNNNITVTSDETVSGLHSFTMKFCVKKHTLNSLLPKLTEKCPNYKLTVSPTDKVKHCILINFLLRFVLGCCTWFWTSSYTLCAKSSEHSNHTVKETSWTLSYQSSTASWMAGGCSRLFYSCLCWVWRECPQRS